MPSYNPEPHFRTQTLGGRRLACLAFHSVGESDPLELSFALQSRRMSFGALRERLDAMAETHFKSKKNADKLWSATQKREEEA